MRLNQFLARSTGMSRRAADDAISQGLVLVNESVGDLGQQIDPDNDQITYNGEVLSHSAGVTIMLHKPVGVVTSRAGQGARTIYDLLPDDLATLKPAGRLDKNSSGLLILSSDGDIIQSLSHPSAGKVKRYEVTLDKVMGIEDMNRLASGIELNEGTSHIGIGHHQGSSLDVELETGWNRQIRRTFEALGYNVIRLHRVSIGQISLGTLPVGEWRELNASELACLA